MPNSMDIPITVIKGAESYGNAHKKMKQENEGNGIMRIVSVY